MKKDRLEKTFLEELSKTSNISITCEKVGLSRQTVYRWMDENIKFRKKVNQALQFGIESISDLAESKLIGHIKSGSQRSIEYWLDNHKHNYIRPRPREFWSDAFRKNELLHGGLFFIDTNGKISYSKSIKGTEEKVELNIKEKDPIFEDMIERYHPIIVKLVSGKKEDNKENKKNN